MKISKITMTLIAACFLTSANAANYSMKIGLEKNSINLSQFYENVGLNPDHQINNPSSCSIKDSDFAVFNGNLLDVVEVGEYKCIVHIVVPKSVFDSACNPQAAEANAELWNMMRSKGVDGVMSIGYHGECS